MRHLAIDIGAESGRGIVGWIEEGRLRMIEVHRFANRPISEGCALYWDIDHLVYECFTCLEMAGPRVSSVGIDTWAVDHVLVDEHGQRLARPRHYRDPRTNGVMEKAWEQVPAREIYERTGIQMLPFNSLYQLLATEREQLNQAACFLTIPDYLHLKLMNGGRAVCEFTNATTTQLYDPRQGDWSDELIEAFGLPRHIFPPVVNPGEDLGVVADSMVRVIAPATHDTGSAIAGAPLAPNSAWISSGTWSILGMEVPEPVINDDAYAANFTNEGGVNQTIRLSKNVMGLWIVQQCRAAWGGTDSYEALMEMAAGTPDTGERIDPDDSKFFAPGSDMPALVSSSRDKGHVVRVVLASLADKYAAVLADAERLAGRRAEQIHLVGGGSQNRLLNQLTADACDRPVVAGPVEATALGNLAVQTIASGEVEDLAAARNLIAHSFPLETFLPCP